MGRTRRMKEGGGVVKKEEVIRWEYDQKEEEELSTVRGGGGGEEGRGVKEEMRKGKWEEQDKELGRWKIGRSKKRRRGMGK